MSEYRKEANQFAKDSGWTFRRFLPIILIALVVLGLTGFALKSAGLFGDTVVERMVFKNSYQRSESFKARIATDEAALAEIQVQLRNPELGPNIKNNLRAQAAGIRIRIKAAKRSQ